MSSFFDNVHPMVYSLGLIQLNFIQLQLGTASLSGKDILIHKEKLLMDELNFALNSQHLSLERED